jgi:hypothetical protein
MRDRKIAEKVLEKLAFFEVLVARPLRPGALKLLKAPQKPPADRGPSVPR